MRTVLTHFGDVIGAETMETEMMPCQQLDPCVSVDVVKIGACVSGMIELADVALFDDAPGKRRLFLWRRVDQLMSI